MKTAVETIPVDYTSNLVLIREYQAGNESVMDTLVRINAGLVTRIAENYTRYGIPLEDLIQQGYIGLIKAVRKWVEGRDVKNHLISRIRADIQRYCEQQCHQIRSTKNKNERTLFYRRALVTQLNDSTDEGERAAIMEQIQNETGLSEDQILEAAANISLQVVSLDKDIAGQGNGKAGSLYDLIDGNEETLEEEIIREDVHAKLRTAIGKLKLTERERFILQSRYLDEDTWTLEELGEKFDLTRERVRQIEASILARLKKNLIGKAGEYLPGVEMFVARLV